jgi:hypothetical protein
VTPDAIAPLFFLAAALLVVAGAVKLANPRPTAQALVDAGIPARDPWGRTLGAVEVAAGAWALVGPSSGGAIALAAAYLVFAAFLAVVLVRNPGADSCGCAGSKAVPPSRIHLVLNVTAAGVASAYAVVDGPTAARWLSSLGWAAVPAVAGLALAGWLAVVVVTEVPAAWSAWTPPVHREDPHHHHDDHLTSDLALSRAGVGPGHPSLWPGVDTEVTA